MITELLKELLATGGASNSNQNLDQPDSAGTLAAILTTGPEGFDGDDLRRHFLQKSAAEIAAARYLTNDIVEIDGGFGTTAKHFKINAVQINLTRAEFLLLYILAAHGRTTNGLPSPRRVDGGPFLTAEEILRQIDSLRAEETALAEFWSSATFANIHRTVWELRQKIFETGANPNLIQSGPPGEGGYRLSTPPFNTTIRLT